MGDEFNRPKEGFRFSFDGMKVNSRPDTLPPGKYPLAINIRGYSDNTIQTRPGLADLFPVGNANVTDLRAYAALSTDNLPRILARDAADKIWLDDGVQKGTLAGGGASLGAAMIPFRPNASPTPWMYIANGNDYQKFSAPVANAVTQQEVGIKEPQIPPDATLIWINPALGGNNFSLGTLITGANPPWTNGGTAAGVANGTRLSDTCGVVLPDPAPAEFAGSVNSIQVASAKKYQRLMDVSINSIRNVVQDVFPPLLSVLNISAIRYFAGSTGRCIVVPANLSVGPGDQEQSILLQNLLATLRRGSLIKIASEICYVWSVSVGPDGSVAIETSTTSNHTTGDTMTGVPAIQVVGGGSVVTNTITASDVTYAVTTGIGTQTAAASNAFSYGGTSFQPDDYITLGILVDNLANLTEVKLLIDVSDGTFTSDFYYYTIRPSDIASAVANSTTQLSNVQTVTQRAIIDEESAIASGNQLQTASSAQLAPGSSQWTQIVFPLSALTRVGNDQTKSLQNTVKVQILWNASGTVNVATDEILVIGGLQPDVGDIGAPYRYRVRPRSSVTGVVGNPSPATRYGVNPRRTAVSVSLPSAAYDSQIDTWDVFRYGGAVTSWRFIGSTPSANSLFVDNYDDVAAQAGDPLDFDNFEPWPTIDVPNTGTASVVNGTVAVISTTNANVLRYLPGTLVQLGGLNVYTLWARPTLISGNNYLLQFVENAGAGTNVTYLIQEPILANQRLPYLWGPDAAGTLFACGDPLRPGTVSFAKNYAPDSAPDKYNLEVSPPSEPLLGGETIDGLSFIGSSERWWALYPQPQDVRQRYAVVQQPFTRGLAAPYGHCTDGKSLFWWAKDGIWSSTEGSLTDADLNTFFPHEGVIGTAITYAGTTIPPPDYAHAGGFRLAHANGYLYATYLDANGSYHTLVCNLRRKAWSVDVSSPAATVFYHPEQQAGTVLTNASRYPELLAGTVNITPARVLQQQDLANDQQGRIGCTLAMGEYDGGDVRAPKQWGDFFVDCLPAANFGGGTGISVTPYSLGAAVAPVTVIPQATARARVPISVGGVVVSDFLGFLATWLDDFTAQSVATKLYLWQPSFVIQPAATIAWFTFGSSFDGTGYMHVQAMMLAWVSTAPITLTITSVDGQSPAPITIPSSGGAYTKALFVLTANKGVLYNFQATSAAKFQLFLGDSEIRVGQWGREGAYRMSRNFGDKTTAEAVI